MLKETFINLMQSYIDLNRPLTSTRGNVDEEESIDSLFIRAMEAGMGDTDKVITDYLKGDYNLANLRELYDFIRNK